MSLTNGKSHFGVSPRCKYAGIDTREQRTAEQERRKADRATVKAAGFPSQKYFEYRNGDEAGKARCKKQAEAYAAKVHAKTGVDMEVSEGFFMNLW